MKTTILATVLGALALSAAACQAPTISEAEKGAELDPIAKQMTVWLEIAAVGGFDETCFHSTFSPLPNVHVTFDANTIDEEHVTTNADGWRGVRLAERAHTIVAPGLTLYDATRYRPGASEIPPTEVTSFEGNRRENGAVVADLTLFVVDGNCP